MQPKFTLKRRGSLLWLTPGFFILFSLFSVNVNAQSTVIYQTDDNFAGQSTITDPAANGAAVSMGDAIVLAGTNRYINSVQVRLFSTTADPVNITLRLYTDCSTDGSANSACGNGPGVLVPNSTITLSNIIPVPNDITTVTFNYTGIVNLTAEADNQINVVLNASRAGVGWFVGGSPVIGSLPPGEPATSFVTRCGSSQANNGCSRAFAGINSNFDIKIMASANPCVQLNATAPVISSVPSSTCAGTPITLSVLGGSLNGAANWVWYSGSCGGTLEGTGNSVTVTPLVTTTYFARGEGGCAPGPGACGSQVVTVTPCTCLTPDVATICAGAIQPLSVSGTFTTFSGSAITINDNTTATPYPANITVTGLPATGAGVSVSSVTINGISHTFPSDVDILLQSPTGQNVILMADAGGGTAITNQNVTLSDGAAGTIPGPIVTGTYRPTSGDAAVDNFPVPGPGAINQTTPTLASFTGAVNPNGTWKLFVVDDAGIDFGTITSWSITFRVGSTAVWTAPAGPNTMFSNSAATTAYVAGTQTDKIWVRPTATTTYTATITGGPCNGANNVTVNVNALPIISVTPNPGGCSPATLTATGGIIYNWSGPATTLSAATGATVTATTPVNAVYSVIGIGANGCAAAPVTVPVTGSSISAVISSLGAPATTVWNEGFETATFPPTGWSFQNRSNPLGASNWTRSTAAGAQSGTAFALVNFNSTTGAGTISNWFFTPQINNLTNGDQLTFWSRANDGTPNGGPFPDRLQVRLSSSGASTNVGATETSFGDFSTLLLDINPNLTATGYPFGWTQFTATVSGLAAPVAGRFAFRYFVTNGGPAGANSDIIFLDNVSYQKPPLATCAFNTSSIKVDITGGTSPYTVIYSDGTTNRTVSGYVSGAPIQVTPGVTTTYTIVSVTGANNCSGSGNTGSAVITVTPPPSITTQPPNRTICDGQNTTFTVTAGPALGTSYQWQVSVAGGPFTNLTNTGVYSTVTTATLTITGATTALSGNAYRVVITGACPPNSVTSTAGTLTINVPPTITTQPANLTRCVGTTAAFSIVATGNTPTYQWQVSTNLGLTWTNITGATAATLSITAAQIMNNNQYRVVVTVAPCGTTVTSNAASLTVNPLPTVTISSPVLQLIPGRTSTITAVSTPTAVSYVWTRNGTTVTGVTGSTLTANINGIGTYRATATDANGCVNSSNNLVIGTDASDRLFIYPNPTTGVIQARLYYGSDAAERREVTIYNAQGQLVAKKSYDLFRGMSPYLQMDFDLTRSGSGTYLMKVTEKNTGKIVAAQFMIL